MLTEKHLQMVIVSDEYGGVAGIVTVEDLIESIVGNIQDEFDDEEEEIEQMTDGRFVLEGTSDIGELAETLEIDFPEGEYDTIGGFIMSELGRIPTADENAEVRYGGYIFTVTEMDERRISKVEAEEDPDYVEENEETEND